MNEWFQGLAPRERLVVVGGGLITLVVLLYLLAIEPVLVSMEERRNRVASLEEQVAWMTDAAAEVEALRASGAGRDAVPENGADRPPYVVVESALDGSGLRPTRLEPANRDGAARLEFDEVPFDGLVRLTGELRTESGLEVTEARIRRLEDGLVSADLLLERAE